ncbi:MAG: hypothetical protein WD734_06800 [Dehalococcoidia bacterium]
MADVSCPQCGTVSELEEDEQGFCPNCDYPLFWAGRGGGDEEAEAERSEATRGEIDLDAQATDLICRSCAERNPGSRTFCQRCGADLTPPPTETFDPEVPPMMAEFPPPRDGSSRVLGAILGVIVLAALGVGGYYGFLQLRGEPPLHVVTLDATSDTGYDTAITFGEGVPVIAYRSADRSLRYIHCLTADCSEHDGVSLVSQGDPGYDVAIDLVGPPIVIYRDQASRAMRTVRCGTFGCDNSEGTRRFNPLDIDDGGYGTSIAVGGGIAIAAYRTATGALRTAFLCTSTCAESDGTIADAGSDNGRVVTTLVEGDGSPPQTGRGAAIAIPLGSAPYIAYRDEATSTVQLIRCQNRSCTQHDEPLTLASGDVGYDPSMIIGREGFPIIAFRNNEEATVLLVACGDVACSEDGRVTTVVDNGGEQSHEVGFYLRMVAGPDGNPVLAYRDQTAGALKVATCGDAACTGAERSFQVVDGDLEGSDLGHEISARHSDGFLYLSYRDAVTSALKFARVRL